MEALKFKLIKKIVETADVKTFRFAPEKKFEFSPGQFINIYTTDSQGKLIWRAYSVSSSPNKKYVEVTVKMGGEFATFLDGLQIDGTVDIRGPFGGVLNFLNQKDVVLMAGGVGITPFMPGIRYATEKKLDNKITLFYSCKAKENAVFLSELLKIVKKNPNIKLICTLTKANAKSWNGELGRINAGLIKKYIQAHKDKSYFLCGPPLMVDDLIKMLKELGVPADKIRKEAWG